MPRATWKLSMGLMMIALSATSALSACDGTTDDPSDPAAPGVVAAAYRVDDHEPPRDLKPGETYVVSDLAFESKKDIDVFAGDNACGTKDETPYCDVLDPAYASVGEKPFLEKCKTVGPCTFCCHPVLDWPPLSCSITCKMPNSFE